jgi:hypothetical protein
MKAISWFLLISYFDQVIGPSVFYCNKQINKFTRNELLKLLDFDMTDQHVILTNNAYSSINYSFLINSESSRGGYEQMLITYLINETDIKSESLEIIKYLKSKEHIIDQMANEIKSIKWVPALLNIRKTSFEETVLNLTTEEKRKEFITIYQKYYNLLYPDGSRFEYEDFAFFSIKCPYCRATRNIRIPEYLLNKNKKFSKIFIPKFKLCEHAFLVVINNQLKSHTYESVDYALSDLENESLKMEEIDLLLAEKLYEYLRIKNLKKPFYPRVLIRHLHNLLNLKISKNYLYYLCEIVKERFNLKIIWAKELFFDNLEELCNFHQT